MSKKQKAESVIVESNAELPRKLNEPPTEEQVKAVNEAHQARINDRLERMNAIADNGELDREFQDTDGEKIIDDSEEREARAAKDDEEAKDAVKALEHESELEENEEQEEETAAADEKIINGETHYLTVVNGKEKWRTLRELRQTASKVEAADEYLQSASEAVKNASRLALSKDESSEVEQDDLEKTLGSLVMGDEGAIKKVASALRAKPSAVTPDVLQQIDDRLSFRQAVEWFSDEYSDVMSDPYLKRLVTERDAELAQANPEMPYRSRLKAAGNEIRGWKQKISGVSAKSSDDKIARKKTLVNAPSAAGRQAERTEEQDEETLDSVIDSMAKARGQPHSIRHAKH